MTLDRNMSALAEMAGPQIRKLARQGRLVDACFMIAQRSFFPDADPELVAKLRLMFFAGAAELHAMTMYGLEPDQEPTPQDLEFYGHIVDELTRTYGKRVENHMATTRRRMN